MPEAGSKMPILMTFDAEDGEEVGAALGLGLELEGLPEQPAANTTSMKQARNSAMYLFISIPPFKCVKRALMSAVFVPRTFVLESYVAIIEHSWPKCKR